MQIILVSVCICNYSSLTYINDITKPLDSTCMHMLINYLYIVTEPKPMHNTSTMQERDSNPAALFKLWHKT